MGGTPIRELNMYRIEKWGALWKVYPPVDKIGPAVKFKTEAEAKAYVASVTGTAPAPVMAEPVLDEDDDGDE